MSVQQPVYASIETRWFFQGALPPEVDDWFCRGEWWEKSDRREDHYLLFPEAETAGVKFREGKFEIKALVRDFGLQEFATGVRGAVNSWEKWSLSAPPVARLAKLVNDGSGRWVGVGKRRMLRKFAPDSKQGIREIEAGTFPAVACQAEITRIDMDGKDYWSMGFEAYGKDAKTLLEQVAGEVLRDPFRPVAVRSGMVLAPANSAAYPAWLRQVNASNGND